jgi:hypothetical protein
MPATSAAVQILPLFIFILLPALALRIFSFVRLRFRAPSMAFGALLPWNWGHSGHSPHEKELEHGKERRIRTRAGQVAENKKKLNEKSPGLGVDSDAHFPGLVNMSGTHCFMNSTLQVCASFLIVFLCLFLVSEFSGRGRISCHFLGHFLWREKGEGSEPLMHKFYFSVRRAIPLFWSEIPFTPSRSTHFLAFFFLIFLTFCLLRTLGLGEVEDGAF